MLFNRLKAENSCSVFFGHSRQEPTDQVGERKRLNVFLVHAELGRTPYRATWEVKPMSVANASSEKQQEQIGRMEV